MSSVKNCDKLSLTPRKANTSVIVVGIVALGLLYCALSAIWDLAAGELGIDWTKLFNVIGGWFGLADNTLWFNWICGSLIVVLFVVSVILFIKVLRQKKDCFPTV